MLELYLYDKDHVARVTTGDAEMDRMIKREIEEVNRQLLKSRRIDISLVLKAGRGTAA